MVLYKDGSQLAYSVILPDKAETTVSFSHFLISYHGFHTPKTSFLTPFSVPSATKKKEFFLTTFYPPKPNWICPLSTALTVIQEVDSSSLESNYQSFASLMEQRLAELFLVAGRQGSQIVRSRRATTVAGCTVQVRTHLLFVLSSFVPLFIRFAQGFILW